MPFEPSLAIAISPKGLTAKAECSDNGFFLSEVRSRKPGDSKILAIPLGVSRIFPGLIDIVVIDSVAMSKMGRLRDLADDLKLLVERQRSALTHEVTQVFALDGIQRSRRLTRQQPVTSSKEDLVR